MAKWIIAAVVLWWFLRSKGALQNLGLPAFIGNPATPVPNTTGLSGPTTYGCSDCGAVGMGVGVAPSPTVLSSPAPTVSGTSAGAPGVGIPIAKSPTQVVSPFSNPTVRRLYAMAGGNIKIAMVQ